MFERSVGDVAAHLSLAAWAASSASSMSASVERAACVNTRPLIGVITSKY
jgi:hypothetical protein